MELQTGAAGGPFELIFKGTETPQAVLSKDVLVGEVWLASGQSNMERQLGPRSAQQIILNSAAEAAKADYPTFLQFHVEDATSPHPLDTIDGHWVVCRPETALDFTTVGFFFWARPASPTRGADRAHSLFVGRHSGGSLDGRSATLRLGAIDNAETT